MYSLPKAEIITTTELCHYGCNDIAKFKFNNKKLCCSKHPNSCPGKRENFSKLDQTEWAKKSLKTRLETGITKSSQRKATQTRIKNGHYIKLAKIMREHWAENPWNNNLLCPLLNFKNTNLMYQGSYEFEFLEKLESKNGLDWVKNNVRRGPSIFYSSPNGQEKLYISDFIIGNTIYEIKSSWTWNHKGDNNLLEEINRAKLTKCVDLGYNVILVIDGEEKEWQ